MTVPKGATEEAVVKDIGDAHAFPGMAFDDKEAWRFRSARLVLDFLRDPDRYLGITPFDVRPWAP